MEGVTGLKVSNLLEKSLMPSAPIVTIFGGSGFLGRYVTQRFARAGWRIRVAVRRPNEACCDQLRGYRL